MLRISFLQPASASRARSTASTLGRLELPVVRAQADEEAVARGEVELAHVEHRVREAWQAIEKQHPRNTGERGDQDRELECDRDEFRHAVRGGGGPRELIGEETTAEYHCMK